MKLYSIAKKIYHIISAKFLYTKNFIFPNLYLFNIREDGLKKVKRVLFLFNSLEYMHLGDHVFFMPLIKVFIDSGYNVEVYPTEVMREVFVKLNFPVVNKHDCNFEEYDLIISRFELIRRLKKCKSLLIHVSKNLSLPISEQMITELSKYFDLTTYNQIKFDVFNDKNILTKFNLPNDKKLIFFSLYCDASSYLITEHKCNILLNFIKDYANNPSYMVVLVGSKKDLQDDRRKYAFAHTDLRGLTSVIDLFSLANHDNSLYYVGFDSFFMHVFSIYKKHSFVVFRGRITKKQNDMLRKYHTKLFTQENLVSLLN